jgi:micrococcal nuclease
MSVRPRLLLAAILSIAVIATGAQARTLAGRVAHVTDGDTLWVRPAGAGEAMQVRIQGIDAN